MSDSDEKFIAISINKEIKNLCPDLEPEQQITLANIIDNEFNMDVIYKELERHIVGYLDDIGQGFQIIEEDLEGISLDKLLYIHHLEIINKERFNNKLTNSDYSLTEEVYNEVKKCHNSSNPEEVIWHGN